MHHIIPKSRGGKTTEKNLIETTQTKHRAYHTLFGNATPEEAVLILIRDWFYKDKDLKREYLFYLSKVILEIIAYHNLS